MRRAVALTWVVLAILAAQAVRQWEENFDELGFAIAVVVMALVLLASSLIDWYRVMPTHRGPWATLGWTASISLCLVVVGTQPHQPKGGIEKFAHGVHLARRNHEVVG